VPYDRPIRSEGVFQVEAKGGFWYVVNTETGRSKKIGRVGGPRSNGKGINYRDRAQEEANRRNALLEQKGNANV